MARLSAVLNNVDDANATVLRFALTSIVVRL